MSRRDEQSLKQFRQRISTDLGIETDFNDEHSQKQPSPRFATELGISTNSNDLHLKKAPTPISRSRESRSKLTAEINALDEKQSSQIRENVEGIFSDKAWPKYQINDLHSGSTMK
jgi:hypothetical protein